MFHSLVDIAQNLSVNLLNRSTGSSIHSGLIGVLLCKDGHTGLVLITNIGKLIHLGKVEI